MEEEEEEEVEPSPPKKQKKEANTADIEKTKLELEDAELLEMRRKALESLTKKREDERRQEEWEEERKIIIPLNDDSSTDRNMLDRYFGIGYTRNTMFYRDIIRRNKIRRDIFCRESW